MKRLFPLAAMVLVTACLSSGPPTRPNEREWSKLSAEYVGIQQIRATSPRPAETSPRKEQLEVMLENHRRVEPLLLPFLERLKEYYDRTGDVRASDIYAAERIRIGDDYLRHLARYDRAVNMYQAALAIDPDNEEAKQKLAVAESKRFVSMDDFARVKEGMRDEEVRRILGMPREDWIKQVSQRNRIFSVWIYPRKDGGAAAVYFDGEVVYHTNWNAAPSKGDTN
jgi:tetratricopeptide (TPR) repeat protein